MAKYSLSRTHTLRPEEYESLVIGARVEVDTEVDTGYEDMSPVKIGRELGKQLDDLLDNEVDQALSLGGLMRQSYLQDYYYEGN